MRYARDHKEKTRRRILSAAARRFRERGYNAAGVDEVMKAAGLTAGAFYAHFASKRALLAETLRLSLDPVRQQLLGGPGEARGPAWLRAVVGRYLSRTHRDHPEAGCPLPSLAAEIAREGFRPRLELQRYLEQLVAELAPRTPPAPGLAPPERVLATVALLSGALTLSRAVQDPDLSDRILRAARRLAVPEIAEAATAAEAADRERRPA
jgi:TetR/AcrR family transcriptional regulator, transcriptional repressor for nem operon